MTRTRPTTRSTHAPRVRKHDTRRHTHTHTHDYTITDLLEEVEDDLGGVGQQVVEASVETENGEDGVAAHVRVAMVQVVLHRGHERLQQFDVLELAHEPQSTPADVLVGVVEVVPEGVAGVPHPAPRRRQMKEQKEGGVRGGGQNTATHHRRFSPAALSPPPRWWLVGIHPIPSNNRRPPVP